MPPRPQRKEEIGVEDSAGPISYFLISISFCLGVLCAFA
jgi:hypothetical protein